MCVSRLPSYAADPEDLAISFQVLETARVIYSRHYGGPGRVVEESAEEAEKKAAAAAAAAGEEEEKEGSRPAAAAAAAVAVPAAAAAAPAAAAAAAPAAAASDAASYTMSQKDIGLALALTYEILAQWFLEKGQPNYSARRCAWLTMDSKDRMHSLPASDASIALCCCGHACALPHPRCTAEDFEKAYSENTKALALSVPWLESHARDLSALHMNLAVCALFDNKPEPALEHYKNARQALENTVTHLKQQLEQEKANPTPLPLAEAVEPAAPAAAAAAAAATPAAPSAAAEAKPPQTQAEKLAAELAECVEILEELKERVS
jgi:hypothetical protein